MSATPEQNTGSQLHENIRILLNDGNMMPVIGLGTFSADLVTAKLDLKNTFTVSSAMNILDQLWNTFHRPHLVRPAVEQSLHSLQLDYVDLYLMNHPISVKALEQCKDAGLVKSIGVSNFNRRQLEMILNKPGLK